MITESLSSNISVILNPKNMISPKNSIHPTIGNETKMKIIEVPMSVSQLTLLDPISAILKQLIPLSAPSTTKQLNLC